MKIQNKHISSSDAQKALATEKTHRRHRRKLFKKSFHIPHKEGTQVALSSRAKQMARAKEIAKHTPDVREKKIAFLKAQIESGKYHIDPDKIAERMFDEHLM